MIARIGVVGRVAATALSCTMLLGGCGSARFGGRAPVVTAARAAPRVAPSVPAEPADTIVETVPSGSVSSEPLPPPSGASGVAPEVLGRSAGASEIPTLSGSPSPIETLGGPVVASLPRPLAPAGSSRSASIGGWTAREATGTSCRVTLSSTPTLDLYRASAGACANRDLAGVTGWDYRDGEVYLFQPGGAVAARLRPSGGTLAGVLSKSGAPLTLTR